jgi:nicotinamide-nucleotide amidase
VAYANDVKVNQLGVKQEDLDAHGAVSQEVVEQMATGIVKLTGTDYGLSTSGIAGPDGGSEEKPVGTVWIAMATSDKVVSKLLRLGEHRGRNIRISALAALNMLRLELAGNGNGDVS